ncbi:MAG: hypothetical protein KDK23_02500 [Leptospiraceae bacterium]|nr:hypothetical protein [Leptospiraceae bacterium]
MIHFSPSGYIRGALAISFCLPILLSLHCGYLNGNALSGTEWICGDAFDPQEGSAMPFPDASQKPTEGMVREVYHRDGELETFDAVTGDSLLEEEAEGMRWRLISRDGKQILQVDVKFEGEWSKEEEAPPYVVVELNENRFHTVLDHTWSDGYKQYHEAKCSRMD